MKSRAAVVAALLVAPLTWAQGGSVLTGTVTDAATSQPVADVVVTATSPSLQGEQTAVTDSSGAFRLGQLPAGVYALRLEKDAYRPHTREAIGLRLAHTVRINLQLMPEAVQGETITVVGRAPTVDVGSTTGGLTVGREYIDSIPFALPNWAGVRTFESLAGAAPQSTPDGYGYSLAGAQSPEHLYLVDGVSVSDPSFGINGAQFPLEFVDQANVITSGYQAEYGRATGGVMNVVTKSGSNEFHGSVWGNWTPGLLAPPPRAIPDDASAVVYRERVWNVVDFGADIGGPIIKDRLWFYVGLAPSFFRVDSTRWLRRNLINEAGDDFVYCTEQDVAAGRCARDELGFIRTETLPGTLRQRFDDRRTLTNMAKLTFLIDSNNKLSLSVIDSPTARAVPFRFGQRQLPNGWNGGFEYAGDARTVSLKYQGAFLDKHLLVDASAGYYTYAESARTNDGSQPGATPGDGTAEGTPAIAYDRARPHSVQDFETLTPEAAQRCEPAGFTGADAPVVDVRGQARLVMACPAPRYVIGGAGGGFRDIARDRAQARASLTWLVQGLGLHVVKAGIDFERLSERTTEVQSGGAVLYERPSGTTFWLTQWGWLVGPDEVAPMSVLEKSASSVGFGAYGQDSWSVMDLVTVNAGLRYETQQLFVKNGQLALTLNNMLSPRLGVIYDFTRQGRSKLYASYARFYESVPLFIGGVSLENAGGYFERIQRRVANASRPGCDPLLDVSQALNECMDPRNSIALNDPNDVSQFTRTYFAGKTPIDPNLQPQSADEVTAGAEYEVFGDARVGVSWVHRSLAMVVEDISLDDATSFFIGNPGYGIAAGVPKAVREYDGVTASFNKSFSDGWMALVSYTWSSLRGNYSGPIFLDLDVWAGPNVTPEFDIRSMTVNRLGPLPGDRTHAIKAWASKEFQATSTLSVVVGASWDSVSGAPINYYAADPLYGDGRVLALPRGSGGRLPWTHTLNAKAGIGYRVSKDVDVQLTADVFNLLNLQQVTSVDQVLTDQTVIPFQTNDPNPQAAACLTGEPRPECFDEKGNPTTRIRLAEEHGFVLQSQLNPNFKRPTSYQQPISGRIGLRVTF